MPHICLLKNIISSTISETSSQIALYDKVEFAASVKLETPKDTVAHLYVSARGDYVLSASDLLYES